MNEKKRETISTAMFIITHTHTLKLGYFSIFEPNMIFGNKLYIEGKHTYEEKKKRKNTHFDIIILYSTREKILNIF